MASRLPWGQLASISTTLWLRQPEQPLAVADQQLLKHRFWDLQRPQLVQASLGLDERVVAPENKLVLQPVLQVAHDLRRDVPRRPARDVDVDVRLVQGHRQQLRVPWITEVGRDDV